MARFVSFLVLVAILVITSIIFFQVMAGFFVPLFLAALLGVVVQPLYRWILTKCKGYRHVAAGITTGLVALIVLLPIGLVVSTATLEGMSLLDRLQLGNVQHKLAELRQNLGLEIPRAQDLRGIEAVLHNWREKQRQGEPLDFDPKQVKLLIARVESIAKWLEARQKDDPSVTPDDAAPLKSALEQLLIADDEAGLAPVEDPPAPADAPLAPVAVVDTAPDQAVLREDALLLAGVEFREFKRKLLGGIYRAWLTEWANPSDEQVEQLRLSVLATAGPVLNFGGDTLAFLAKLGFGTLIMIVSLFFLLAEGARMLEALIQISPLEEQHVRELAAEFDRACRAIVSATLLSAIAQGLLAGIGFYLCGLRSSVALLMLLTMVFALVPFTGAAAVWIPVALYLYFFQGSTAAAVGLALYGAIIISTSDNIIKPLVLHGQSKLHPLLALLSVLGGIQALGPIGIVVGPMVVVFLQTLLKIIHRELVSMDRSSWMFWRGFGAAAPAVGAAANVTTGPPGGAALVEPPSTAGGSPPSPKPGTQGNGHASPAKNPPQPQGKKRRK
jgi:predicted PurR-regulated permease PerM